MELALVEIACGITAKQIRDGRVEQNQVVKQLRKNFQVLMQVNNAGVASNGADTPPRVVSWRRSIRNKHIVCLECGLHAKYLGAKHLAIHDLTASAYRKKYGMPCTQGLTCKELAASRREMVQRWRFWEKSPTAMAAQKRAVAQ